MEVARPERDTKLRKDMGAQAVALALQGKWDEAAAINRELVDLCSEDVEALNRLGKAYLELGRYGEAQEAFTGALSHSPHNTIAKKNLERLSHLQEKGAPPVAPRKASLNLFIEESGKSGVIVLHKPAPRHVLAKVAAGDPVNLRCEERRLLLEDLHGEYLGEVGPKLGTRLLRLIRSGNKYSGAVVSVHHQEVAVTLREIYTDPSLRGVCSFPSRGSEEQMAYLRNSNLHYDLESESDDEELQPEWGVAEDPALDESPRPQRALIAPDDGEDEDEEE